MAYRAPLVCAKARYSYLPGNIEKVWMPVDRHEALGIKPFDDQILVDRAGGFIGSVLRYRVSGFVQMLSQGVTLPFGTLAVNILGCFCIGFLSELCSARTFIGVDAQTFLLVGILGGCSTFRPLAMTG